MASMPFYICLFSLAFSTVFFAEEENRELPLPSSELIAEGKAAVRVKTEREKEGYTINYHTISIIEYIRFASKICKVNFIYQEADLDFTVTVVSDEPVSEANVMATLIQVLRVHGLMLLEQGNNLVIHKSGDVKQMAALVTDGSQNVNAPIVTRVFRIRNTKPEAISAIIQPMISASAILEVLSETKQLILTDITANVNKIAALIENLDSPHTSLQIKSYKPTHNTAEYLLGPATQIMAPIAQGNPFLLVPQHLANEIFLVSTPELVQQGLAVLSNLDTSPEPSMRNGGKEQVLLYRIQQMGGNDLLKSLKEIARNLKSGSEEDPDLISTIEHGRFIKESNSLLFTGSSTSIEQIKLFLANLDSSSYSIGGANSFFIYKPQNRNADEIKKSLLEVAESIPAVKETDQSLLQAIRSAKVNSASNTLSFFGNEKIFPQLKELLTTVDVLSSKSRYPGGSQFFVYKPTSLSGEQILNSLKELQEDLQQDHLSDPSFLRALSSAKWVKSTHSLLFTGDVDSLKKIQGFLETIDHPQENVIFFQYQPKYVDRQKTESYLKQIAQNLSKKGTSLSLVDVIRSSRWIPESQSFLFQGSPADIEQIKSLLGSFDTQEAENKMSYYIYKLQNANGELLEEDLDHLVKNMKSSGMQDTDLVELISKIKYIKQTNSLLLSGTPRAVEEAKKLIAEYDYPRPAAANASNFWMYKPQTLNATQFEKSLSELAQNLKGAGLADPHLLKAIEKVKYVESTNTFIFTGSPDTLQKIQAIVQDIDAASSNFNTIQQIGKSTFLLYKLKNANGPQILSSIKNMTSELKKSKQSDKELVATLSSAKYIKETNSLLFTGSNASLTKAQEIVEQFDVSSFGQKSSTPSFSGQAPGSYFVYKPQYLSGPDLEAVLQNFAENLRSSGLVDPDLYQTINSLRWSDKTQTIVFTGTPKSLDQIKELLREFDTNANGQGSSKPDGSIQPIDNTNFLVYKLQFHKGDEIQNALRQIAKDLMLSNAPINQNLLNSINSIQWLEVTNSILCSGDQETLTRLRELIKNLDISLKQVFIEMLVIETTLTNALQFGLEWGANYKYRNKFGGSTYNSQPINLNNSPSSWLQNFSGFTPPTEPNPIGKIPVSSGFDLGVIGEVIRHNGQTFLTLGSLMSALQTDDETSVIMTPKILTQDGRTSTIFDGRNIPFVGSFVQNNSQNTVNTSNIEYRDIGLNLTVTPVLGNSDIVTLDINLDRTQTVGDINGSAINFNSQSAQGITTTKTSMQTTVHVPDNHFLILSGMVNNSNSKTKAGIPCLGGLPLVGAAFSKSADTIVSSNIVIFIRPHIINSIEKMESVTHKEEEFFRDQTGTPFLEKNYNEAMELIKTIDDE